MARHKSKPNPGRNLRLADQIQKDLAVLIQREIENELALKLLDGTFRDGDTIRVDASPEGLTFS